MADDAAETDLVLQAEQALDCSGIFEHCIDVDESIFEWVSAVLDTTDPNAVEFQCATGNRILLGAAGAETVIDGEQAAPQPVWEELYSALRAAETPC